jgi:CBS domain-containing protein
MAEFVREVMTPGVVVVPPDASLVEAAQLMRAQDIGDVLVASDSRVLGVLTDRDITLRAVADGADPLTVSARAVCTPNPVVVGPGDELSVAVGLMREHAIRRLPVVDEDRAVGMVSIGDIAIAQEPQSALAEISRADRHRQRRGVGAPRGGSTDMAEPPAGGW